MRKKQCNIYNSGTRPIKLVQKKLPTRLDILSEVGKLKYEKNIIICQVSNRRDQVVVWVFLINSYNVQNLRYLTSIVRSAIHNY